MKYRSEIDGLRAVAVVPVILFHAGVPAFSGGFVGVDVFFVISGYLITTIILSEMDRGSFSLINFYERRARRILPALFLVMFASLVVAWFWYIPRDMKDFSQSLIAVSTFISNILFWHESGYWEASSELKPLLHTWSLAVEEQYYILFPLFLMLMWSYRKRWIFGSFLIIAGISLAAAQWGAYHKPTATFYLLPTRGWELAIGAAIAFYFLYSKQSIQSLLSHKLMSEILGLSGLLMIGYAIFVFDKTTPFPSLYALVPTIGAGLIILFASSKTLTGRLLSTKVAVAIGLISYSAYLWHQPLLAFAKYGIVTEPNIFIYVVIAFFSFPLAYLSWKYIEKPFRNKDILDRKAIFIFSATGTAFFITIGLLGHYSNGFYNRYTDNQKHILDYQKYDRSEAYREGSCFLTPEQNHTDFKEECFSNTNTNNSIILWGDSHSAALSYGLRKTFKNLTQLTASGCRPLKDFNPKTRPNCLDINNYILSKTGELKPKLLFIHANWVNSLNNNNTELVDALSNTVSHIKSISPATDIILIGGTPNWHPSLPGLLVRYNIELHEMAYVHSQDYKKIQQADEILSMYSTENNLTFISLLDIFCKDDQCLSAAKDGNIYEPFAWDYGHLTRSSSSLVSENILLKLKENKNINFDYQ